MIWIYSDSAANRFIHSLKCPVKLIEVDGADNVAERYKCNSIKNNFEIKSGFNILYMFVLRVT